MVTMSDIAKAVGVSRSTVSFALSDKKYSNVQIPENTRQRIRETAVKMGFQRNVHAEYLSRGQTPTIGVFLPNINDRLIADLVIGLSRKIANSGFPLEFHFDLSATPERCVTDAYSAYSKFIEKALREHRCGLITYRYFYYDPQIVKLIEEFQKQGGKMLMINSFGHFPEVPSVCIDDARGGELAARHLLEKNCDHFIYCDPTDEPRSAGFIEALSTAGRRRQLKIFEQRDYTAAVLTYLLSLPRSARPGIFMPSDVDAIRFLSAARERGLEVRKDFLLIGYDGQLLTDMLATPLSTIFQPFLELGEKAAETILQLIEGKSVKNSLIEPYLIERDSSRPL
ncbi:LacI family DNA-binding transcriptional regulator [Victivallis sp. Marseille-Q1083]|uniref:LacI family DNA-binding transcriptional regulator n=1 Tax=Victivallis sp. Marseille-Q1083 TaxID=2717288 RepID=UPI00158DE128|nr:LacI family DNA-binding transcriptional regulator [Victivallis sp. Marseille-Q1083]